MIELVNGMPMHQHCNARRLGINERLALFDHVLSAAVHAHTQLVVHHDIKPSNILVTADGTVKLLDFGSAKLLQDEAAAAPEQWQGRPLSTAIDVFAPGVLLYRLLAERHPTGPRLRQLLGGDREKIVARALRQNPGERYQTVAALAEDLRRYRNDEPVSARPVVQAPLPASDGFAARNPISVTASPPAQTHRNTPP